ncbi:MAG: isochorismate synthase [Bacteroidota bacterium]
MIDFFIKVKQQEAQKLPFVIFSKPNKNKLIGYFQKDEHLYSTEDFTEKGFVFAPFDGCQTILIPKKKSQKWKAELTVVDHNPTQNTFKEDNSGKNKFETLVQKGIDAIKKGSFHKVVLSREEIIDLSSFDLVAVFENLVRTYPTAFTYCWFHPKVGLWMGATPELLLKANEYKFSTMALAGTQSYNGNIDVVWENKEKKEQQFVTDYIIENIKEIASEVSVSSPYTLKAGNVLHIKTDIHGTIKEGSNLKDVVAVLHPTPAVCGLPKETAKNFIIDNEGYDRQYYTGFLGEINWKGFLSNDVKSDLYVNLRCMQIKNNQAYLYIGCGITKDSIPENEWQETVNKSVTMKKIIV